MATTAETTGKTSASSAILRAKALVNANKNAKKETAEPVSTTVKAEPVTPEVKEAPVVKAEAKAPVAKKEVAKAEAPKEETAPVVAKEKAKKETVKKESVEKAKVDNSDALTNEDMEKAYPRSKFIRRKTGEGKSVKYVDARGRVRVTYLQELVGSESERAKAFIDYHVQVRRSGVETAANEARGSFDDKIIDEVVVAIRADQKAKAEASKAPKAKAE